jgi:hypothetical protein
MPPPGRSDHVQAKLAETKPSVNRLHELSLAWMSETVSADRRQSEQAMENGNDDHDYRL